jgi:hypothetical protein
MGRRILGDGSMRVWFFQNDSHCCEFSGHHQHGNDIADGAGLLGTSNDFLAIRSHLNTKQHIANVHCTSLQALFKTISCQVYNGEIHSRIYSENTFLHLRFSLMYY